MLSFEEILKQSKQSNKKEYERKNEVKYVKKSINILMKSIEDAIGEYVQYINNEGLNEKEKDMIIKNMSYSIEKSIQDFFVDILKDITENMPSESEAHFLNSYQYLLYNPNEFRKIYRELKNEKISGNKPFSLNIEENQKNVVEKILKIFRDTKNQIEDEEYQIVYNYEKDPQYRKQLQRELDENSIKYIKEMEKYVGKEEDKVLEFFKSQRHSFYNNIKQKYITSLIKYGNILDGFGLLRKYQEQHENGLANIGLRRLAYACKSNDENDMDLTKLFDEETLKKQPIKSIIALNSFWSNRLAKEIERLDKARFICQDLGIFETVLKQKSDNPQADTPMPTDKEIEKELLKLNVLKFISKKSTTEIEKDIEKLNRKEKENTCIEVEPYVNAIASYYQDEYYKYFKKEIPNSANELSLDIIDCITANNVVQNLYVGKNSSQLSLLESTINSELIGNWGYIKDDTKEGYILLGFDIEGLNMPLRLHMEKKYLKGFLDENGLENKIPVYQGDRDFTIYGGRINSPILIPLDNKRIIELRKTEIDFQKDPDMSRYIEHCKYLINTANDKFPKHLKKLKIIGKGKNEKKKYIIPNEYIDIETEEIFEKTREGEFTKKNLGRNITDN